MHKNQGEKKKKNNKNKDRQCQIEYLFTAHVSP
jgi:hypothetical protein